MGRQTGRIRRAGQIWRLWHPEQPTLSRSRAEAGGTIDVISGVGAARALTVLGAVDLTGSVTTGALVLNGYSSVLSLGNRASLSVSGGVSDAIGTFDIAGGSLDVGGAWTSNVYDDVNGLVYGGTDIRVHDGGSLVVGGAFDTLGTTSEFRGSEYLWAVDGNITLDGALNVTASAAGENILVGDAGRISALSLNANGASASLYIGVDATSSLEIGTSKTAAAGSITIDSGATASVTSGFWDAPEIAVNGTISVLAGAQLTIFGTGASQDLSPLDYYIAGFVDYFHNPSTAGDGLTGTGTIQLGAGAQLGIAGVRLDAAFTIALSGGADTLVIGDNSLNASNIFVPTITGFNSGDVIDLADLTYKSSYRPGMECQRGHRYRHRYRQRRCSSRGFEDDRRSCGRGTGGLCGCGRKYANPSDGKRSGRCHLGRRQRPVRLLRPIWSMPGPPLRFL